MTQPPANETPPQGRIPGPDEWATGPEVGEMLPDFTLPDQHGALVTLSEARNGHRALVLFHRSVRW